MKTSVEKLGDSSVDSEAHARNRHSGELTENSKDQYFK